MKIHSLKSGFFIFEAKLIPSELLNESDFRKIQGGGLVKSL